MVMDDLEMISNCKRLGSGDVFTGLSLFARFQVLLQFQTIETFIILELLIKIKGLVGDDETRLECLRKETQEKQNKKWCLETHVCIVHVLFLYNFSFH